MLKRNTLTTLVGIIVAIIAAYFAIRDVDGQALRIALAAAHYGYVVPALIFTLLGYVARAWRWQALIAPAKPVPFKSVFPQLVIGIAWNVAIPLRIGELVRAHLLGQREHVSRSMLLATIVVERVLDGVAIMAMLGAVAWLHPALPDWALSFSYSALLIFGVAFSGLIMLIVSESLTLRLLDFVTRHLPQTIGGRLNRFAQKFMQGFGALRSPTGLWQVALSTVAIWFVEVASYAALFPAFEFAFDAITFASAASFYAVVLNLSSLIPSSPGNVGTMEYFGELALSIFGISPAPALSFTLVNHAVQLVVIIALGVWALWREGLSVNELARQSES